MSASDWPQEDVLRAILELPGVAGETLAAIHEYLDDPEATPEACMSAENEAGGVHLRRQLNAAVQAHWGQLCALGKV